MLHLVPKTLSSYVKVKCLNHCESNVLGNGLHNLCTYHLGDGGDFPVTYDPVSVTQSLAGGTLGGVAGGQQRMHHNATRAAIHLNHVCVALGTEPEPETRPFNKLTTSHSQMEDNSAFDHREELLISIINWITTSILNTQYDSMLETLVNWDTYLAFNGSNYIRVVLPTTNTTHGGLLCPLAWGNA